MSNKSFAVEFDSKYPDFRDVCRLFFSAESQGRLSEAFYFLKENFLSGSIFKNELSVSDELLYSDVAKKLDIDIKNVLMVVDTKNDKSYQYDQHNGNFNDAISFFMNNGEFKTVFNHNGDEKVFSCNFCEPRGCGVLRMISVFIGDLEKKDPESVLKNKIRELEDLESKRINLRLLSMPAAPDDFWDAIKFVYDYCESKDEFIKLTLGADSVDLSDRNRTRIGRAMLGMEDNSDSFERGDKRSTVTIYRACPAKTKIGVGDWVTMSKGYALGHARAYNERVDREEDKLKISQKTVPESHVLWDQSSEDEFFYVPTNLWGDIKNENQLWDKINVDKKPDTLNPYKKEIDKLKSKLKKMKTGNESNFDM